ncbi:sulfite exporter TauE/SafE family protein [Jiella mangrovi]|uniref:Probable membrane transporter protein n=1 Tax=Jiella mangrovi TaxID=2821407 RepID=A0ABS4BM09_9HYPH|nr:sulfite exporter TauE/SafE family protein [Jiella mangrovi]MBP0617701.1 sulfite exporter TauE/SafE family protein [Jiella mangrovi]
MPADLIYALPIIVAAAVVRGATGFGFSLVAAPLLSLFWSPDFATGIVLCLDLAATVMLVQGGILAELERGDALLLGASALGGAVAGVFLLSALPHGPALVGLNLAVFVSALAAMRKVSWRWLDSRGAASGAGFLTGAMIGAFSVGGTLIVAWLMASRRSPGQSRALLTVVFAVTDIGAIAFRAGLGLFPASSLPAVVVMLPAVAAGIVVGRRLYGRISAETWKRAVAWLLMLLALSSLASMALPASAALSQAASLASFILPETS